MDISEVQAVQIVCLINQGLLSQRHVASTLELSNNFNNVWLLVKKIKNDLLFNKVFIGGSIFLHSSVIIVLKDSSCPIDDY